MSGKGKVRYTEHGQRMDCGCYEETGPVCDFCLHFLFYRDRNGNNIDGSGWCGLKRQVTDAGDGCDDYYCERQWRQNFVEPTKHTRKSVTTKEGRG